MDDQDQLRPQRTYDFHERPFEAYHTYGQSLVRNGEGSSLPHVLLPRIPLRVQQVFCQDGKATRHANFRLEEHDV